ncbi:MAG TPA: PKD domain-containing protein [Candidatus Thermoplasmatota archaeon]
MKHMLWVLGLIVSLAAPPAIAQDEAIANELPIAAFLYEPSDPKLDEIITFRSEAIDPDGVVVNWTWSFGDGTVAYGPVVQHEFRFPGTYIVSLTVTDDQGAAVELGREVILYAPAVPNWLGWSIPMLVSVVLFGIAYLVVLRGQPNIYNKVFFLFYATSAVKSLTEALLVLVGDPDAALHRSLLILNALTGFILIPLFLWLVLVFPRPVAKWLRDGGRGVITLLLVIPFAYLLFSGDLDVRHYAQVTDIFNVYASIVALLALGLLVYHAWETDSEEERRRIRLLSATFFLLVFTTLVLTGLNIGYSQAATRGEDATAYQFLFSAAIFGLVVSPILEIVGATILMYAILRYQLMGIDHLVGRISRGTLLALIVPSLFITVGNGLEELLQNSLLGGVTAAFLIAGFVSALLMIPIQKLVTFLINRMFPGWDVLDAHETSSRRMEIFEAQLRYSLLDGALTEKETRLLRRLASSLGLPADEVHEVVTQVTRAGPNLVDIHTLIGSDHPTERNAPAL